MATPDLSSSSYLTFLAVSFILVLIAAFAALLWSYLAQWREDRYAYDPLAQGNDDRDVELESAIPLRRLAWDPEERMDDAPPTITAANFCRSKYDLRWGNLPLHHIGRRAAKSYFAVSLAPSRRRCLASVLRVRHSSPVDPASPHFQEVASLVAALDHPNVAPCHHAQYIRESASLVVVRDLEPRGSLRDYLHGEASPTDSFAAKYSHAGGAGAPLERVALWCRHVLDALSYLRRGGLRVCNLHAGNVLLAADGRAMVTDVECDLVGAPPETAVARQARTVLARDAGSAAAARDEEEELEPEVLLFGQLLFELAVGWRMESPTPDFVGLDVAPDVAKVLRRIFDLSLPRRYRSLAALRRCSLFRRVDGFADAPRRPPWEGDAAERAVAAASAITSARFSLPGRYHRVQRQQQQQQSELVV